MEGLERAHLRPAEADDADSIARLHADSWRRHYRGAYSDAFLDGDVVEDRLSVWRERLGRAGADRHTVVATTAEGVVGFAHTIFDDDPSWGALLDNLHVSQSHARRGLGTRLLATSAMAVVRQRPGSALHLWVLEQNVAAQSFYTARGGRCVERRPVLAPGGVASRLNGSVMKLRFVWPDPAAAAAAPRGRAR